MVSAWALLQFHYIWTGRSELSILLHYYRAIHEEKKTLKTTTKNVENAS